MTALQGQVNNVNISDKIYQDIMSITPGRRPFSNRTCSAKSDNSQLWLIDSPRHSAKSKVSQSSKQATYSDFDIIKNRSWSGSKVKNSTFVKSGTKRTDTPHHSQLLSPARVESRDCLSPGRAPGSSSSTGDKWGKQLNSKEVWNLKGSQVQRLQQEWAAVEQCRAMKRASEMVQHRLDPMYRISGSNIPLLERYQVNDSELQRLREMSETSRILQLDLKRIYLDDMHRASQKSCTDSWNCSVSPLQKSSSFSGISASEMIAAEDGYFSRRSLGTTRNKFSSLSSLPDLAHQKNCHKQNFSLIADCDEDFSRTGVYPVWEGKFDSAVPDGKTVDKNSLDIGSWGKEMDCNVTRSNESKWGEAAESSQKDEKGLASHTRKADVSGRDEKDLADHTRKADTCVKDENVRKNKKDLTNRQGKCGGKVDSKTDETRRNRTGQSDVTSKGDLESVGPKSLKVSHSPTVSVSEFMEEDETVNPSFCSTCERGNHEDSLLRRRSEVVVSGDLVREGGVQTAQWPGQRQVKVWLPVSGPLTASNTDTASTCSSQGEVLCRVSEHSSERAVRHTRTCDTWQVTQLSPVSDTHIPAHGVQRTNRLEKTQQTTTDKQEQKGKTASKKVDWASERETTTGKEEAELMTRTQAEQSTSTRTRQTEHAAVNNTEGKKLSTFQRRNLEQIETDRPDDMKQTDRPEDMKQTDRPEDMKQTDRPEDMKQRTSDKEVDRVDLNSGWRQWGTESVSGDMCSAHPAGCGQGWSASQGLSVPPTPSPQTVSTKRTAPRKCQSVIAHASDGDEAQRIRPSSPKASCSQLSTKGSKAFERLCKQNAVQPQTSETDVISVPNSVRPLENVQKRPDSVPEAVLTSGKDRSVSDARDAVDNDTSESEDDYIVSILLSESFRNADQANQEMNAKTDVRPQGGARRENSLKESFLFLKDKNFVKPKHILKESLKTKMEFEKHYEEFQRTSMASVKRAAYSCISSSTAGKQTRSRRSNKAVHGPCTTSVPSDRTAVTVRPAGQSTVAARPADQTAVTVRPADQIVVAVRPADQTAETVRPADQITVAVRPADQSTVAGAEAKSTVKSVKGFSSEQRKSVQKAVQPESSEGCRNLMQSTSCGVSADRPVEDSWQQPETLVYSQPGVQGLTCSQTKIVKVDDIPKQRDESDDAAEGSGFSLVNLSKDVSTEPSTIDSSTAPVQSDQTALQANQTALFQSDNTASLHIEKIGSPHKNEVTTSQSENTVSSKLRKSASSQLCKRCYSQQAERVLSQSDVYSMTSKITRGQSGKITSHHKTAPLSQSNAAVFTRPGRQLCSLPSKVLSLEFHCADIAQHRSVSTPLDKTAFFKLHKSSKPQKSDPSKSKTELSETFTSCSSLSTPMISMELDEGNAGQNMGTVRAVKVHQLKRVSSLEAMEIDNLVNTGGQILPDKSAVSIQSAEGDGFKQVESSLHICSTSVHSGWDGHAVRPLSAPALKQPEGHRMSNSVEQTAEYRLPRQSSSEYVGSVPPQPCVTRQIQQSIPSNAKHLNARLQGTQARLVPRASTSKQCMSQAATHKHTNLSCQSKGMSATELSNCHEKSKVSFVPYSNSVITVSITKKSNSRTLEGDCVSLPHDAQRNGQEARDSAAVPLHHAHCCETFIPDPVPEAAGRDHSTRVTPGHSPWQTEQGSSNPALCPTASSTEDFHSSEHHSLSNTKDTTAQCGQAGRGAELDDELGTHCTGRVTDTVTHASSGVQTTLHLQSGIEHSGSIQMDQTSPHLQSVSHMCSDPSSEVTEGLNTLSSSVDTSSTAHPASQEEEEEASPACSVEKYECLDPLKYRPFGQTGREDTLHMMQGAVVQKTRAAITQHWVQEGGQLSVACLQLEANPKEKPRRELERRRSKRLKQQMSLQERMHHQVPVDSSSSSGCCKMEQKGHGSDRKNTKDRGSHDSLRLQQGDHDASNSFQQKSVTDDAAEMGQVPPQGLLPCSSAANSMKSIKSGTGGKFFTGTKRGLFDTSTKPITCETDSVSVHQGPALCNKGSSASNMNTSVVQGLGRCSIPTVKGGERLNTEQHQSVICSSARDAQRESAADGLGWGRQTGHTGGDKVTGGACDGVQGGLHHSTGKSSLMAGDCLPKLTCCDKMDQSLTRGSHERASHSPHSCSKGAQVACDSSRTLFTKASAAFQHHLQPRARNMVNSLVSPGVNFALGEGTAASACVNYVTEWCPAISVSGQTPARKATQLSRTPSASQRVSAGLCAGGFSENTANRSVPKGDCKTCTPQQSNKNTSVCQAKFVSFSYDGNTTGLSTRHNKGGSVIQGEHRQTASLDNETTVSTAADSSPLVRGDQNRTVACQARTKPGSVQKSCESSGQGFTRYVWKHTPLMLMPGRRSEGTASTVTREGHSSTSVRSGHQAGIRQTDFQRQTTRISHPTSCQRQSPLSEQSSAIAVGKTGHTYSEPVLREILAAIGTKHNSVTAVSRLNSSKAAPQTTAAGSYGASKEVPGTSSKKQSKTFIRQPRPAHSDYHGYVRDSKKVHQTVQGLNSARCKLPDRFAGPHSPHSRVNSATLAAPFRPMPKKKSVGSVVDSDAGIVRKKSVSGDSACHKVSERQGSQSKMKLRSRSTSRKKNSSSKSKKKKKSDFAPDSKRKKLTRSRSKRKSVGSAHGSQPIETSCESAQADWAIQLQDARCTVQKRPGSVYVEKRYKSVHPKDVMVYTSSAKGMKACPDDQAAKVSSLQFCPKYTTQDPEVKIVQENTTVINPQQNRTRAPKGLDHVAHEKLPSKTFQKCAGKIAHQKSKKSSGQSSSCRTCKPKIKKTSNRNCAKNEFCQHCPRVGSPQKHPQSLVKTPKRYSSYSIGYAVKEKPHCTRHEESDCVKTGTKRHRRTRKCSKQKSELKKSSDSGPDCEKQKKAAKNCPCASSCGDDPKQTADPTPKVKVQKTKSKSRELSSGTKHEKKQKKMSSCMKNQISLKKNLVNLHSNADTKKPDFCKQSMNSKQTGVSGQTDGKKTAPVCVKRKCKRRKSKKKKEGKAREQKEMLTCRSKSSWQERESDIETLIGIEDWGVLAPPTDTSCRENPSQSYIGGEQNFRSKQDHAEKSEASASLADSTMKYATFSDNQSHCQAKEVMDRDRKTVQREQPRHTESCVTSQREQGQGKMTDVVSHQGFTDSAQSSTTDRQTVLLHSVCDQNPDEFQKHGRATANQSLKLGVTGREKCCVEEKQDTDVRDMSETHEEEMTSHLQQDTDAENLTQKPLSDTGVCGSQLLKDEHVLYQKTDENETDSSCIDTSVGQHGDCVPDPKPPRLNPGSTETKVDAGCEQCFISPGSFPSGWAEGVDTAGTVDVIVLSMELKDGSGPVSSKPNTTETDRSQVNIKPDEGLQTGWVGKETNTENIRMGSELDSETGWADCKPVTVRGSAWIKGEQDVERFVDCKDQRPGRNLEWFTNNPEAEIGDGWIGDGVAWNAVNPWRENDSHCSDSAAHCGSGLNDSNRSAGPDRTGSTAHCGSGLNDSNRPAGPDRTGSTAHCGSGLNDSNRSAGPDRTGSTAGVAHRPRGTIDHSDAAEARVWPGPKSETDSPAAWIFHGTGADSGWPFSEPGAEHDVYLTSISGQEDSWMDSIQAAENDTTCIDGESDLGKCQTCVDMSHRSYGSEEYIQQEGPLMQTSLEKDRNRLHTGPCRRIMDPALEMLEDMRVIFDSIIDRKNGNEHWPASSTEAPSAKRVLKYCNDCHPPDGVKQHHPISTQQAACNTQQCGQSTTDTPDSHSSGVSVDHLQELELDTENSADQVAQDVFPETIGGDLRDNKLFRNQQNGQHHFMDRNVMRLFPEVSKWTVLSDSSSCAELPIVTTHTSCADCALFRNSHPAYWGIPKRPCPGNCQYVTRTDHTNQNPASLLTQSAFSPDLNQPLNPGSVKAPESPLLLSCCNNSHTEDRSCCQRADYRHPSVKEEACSLSRSAGSQQLHTVDDLPSDEQLVDTAMTRQSLRKLFQGVPPYSSRIQPCCKVPLTLAEDELLRLSADQDSRSLKKQCWIPRRTFVVKHNRVCAGSEQFSVSGKSLKTQA